MKKLQIISIILLLLTVMAMAVNYVIGPFDDWIVRVIGLILLISIFTTVFSSVKLRQK
jgi:membrane protein YdbS with pleckstrin-like domain